VYVIPFPNQLSRTLYRGHLLITHQLGSFINGTIIAIISPRFKRRTMFLTGAIGMLCVYISWIIAVRYSVAALDAGTTNKAAGIAVLFFIYSYSPVHLASLLSNALKLILFIAVVQYWK
jgi:hypothetical protein